MRSRFLLPTVALFGVATGGLHPLVSLGLARLGQGEIIVGLFTAAFYLGAFSGAIGCRFLVEFLWYRRSFSVLATLGPPSTAPPFPAPLLWGWIVLRGIS